MVPHNDIVSEMEGLMEFGVFGSVEEILTVATRRSAETFGMDTQVGTIEPGKLADLRGVDKVFVGGRLVVDGGAVLRGR